MPENVRTIAAALLAAMILGANEPGLLAQAPARSPGGIQVWTSDVVSDEMSSNATKELKPVSLVGVRNGAFSGKLVVESGTAIKGLKVSVGVLTGAGGAIPARNVQVRYATDWLDISFSLVPGRGDILLESPPEAVPANNRGRAVQPVWITVQVPKDAKAGVYTGEVSVQPQGADAVKVPLKLDVQDWTLPDPQDYRTFLDFIESPDTLALEYKTPLWSKKHWELIDRSFKLLSPTGGRTLYVPLICGTNLGNEQSMVRWIPKGDGKYDYDFTVLDKYLDSAEKNLGRPKLVIFQVWDICMTSDEVWAFKRGTSSDPEIQQKVAENRKELLNKGPRVTALDPATNETSILILPRYDDPASKALWQPVFAEIRKHLARRGLEQTMMLGLMNDALPSKEHVAFWKDISGDLPWVIHSHGVLPLAVLTPGNKALYKIAEVGYAAYVGLMVYNVNPAKGRLYGWQNKMLMSGYARGGGMNGSPLNVREFLAFDLTGGQRGEGRIGADFWLVLRNKKGQRAEVVAARYPENNWRNLDMSSWVLAPGPDGAVATARLESLKEGVEECEARIYLEDALLDAAKKAKLGADLAQRCQQALDELHRAMWKTVWNDDADLDSLGRVDGYRFPLENLWPALEKNGKKLPKFWSGAFHALSSEQSTNGQAWFRQGWQEREKKLFALSGEVAAKLAAK